MITRYSAIAALAAVAMLFSMGASGATRQEVIAAKNAAKSGDGARLGASLAVLERAAARRTSQAKVTREVTRKLPVLRASGGYVSISAYGDDLAGLRTQLVSKGLKDATRHSTAISGPRTGGRTSRHGGDAGAQVPAADAGHGARRHGHQPGRSFAARQPGAPRKRRQRARHQDRRAVRQLSTALSGPFEPGAPFTRAADDIASNDLPRDDMVLKDLFDEPSEDCSDEGRAMMQLIHDVAPASPKAFYTAFVSQEDFAAGIRALADAGSEVIVDDVIYFAEPMFEDGIIAQAVDDVYRDGVAYFSSAGNDARLSYESLYRRSGEVGISGPRHDFAPGRAVDGLQSATASAGSVTLLSFQWDQPSLSANGKRGATSDVDVWFYDSNGEPIEICTDDPAQVVCQIPGFDANVGGDAVEIPIMVNLSDADVEVQIGIELFSGPAPNYIKYVWFDLDAGVFTVNEFDTASGTVYGHANAAGAEAVGAAAWYQTEEWGSPLRPQCFPACLNSFSSAGGTPIFIRKNGNRFPIAAGTHQAGSDRPGRRKHHLRLLRPELSRFRAPPNLTASRTSSARPHRRPTWRRLRP